MRAPSSAGAANPRTSARGLSHPYSPASPANGTWLFSDSSEESSSSAGDSILTDDGVQRLFVLRKSVSITNGPLKVVIYRQVDSTDEVTHADKVEDPIRPRQKCADISLLLALKILL